MKSFPIFIIAVLYCVQSYSQSVLLRITNDLENKRNDYPWINYATVIRGDAFSGNKFSRTDSSHVYSAGYKGRFPQTCSDKNLRIRCTEFIRAENNSGKFQLVFNILYHDSVVVWDGKQLRQRMEVPGTWTKIEDEFTVPHTLTGEGYVFAFYLWNEDGKTRVDLDNLEINFEELVLPSFFPKGLIPADSIQEKKFKPIYSDRFFRIDYDKATGHMHILDASGIELIRKFYYFIEWQDSGVDQQRNHNSTVFNFRLLSDSNSAKTGFLRFEVISPVCRSEFNLILDNSSPKVDIAVHTLFLKNILLFRQSLGLEYSINPHEIFRYSSMSDTSAFREEYWLGQGGCLFEETGSSLLILHPGNISSMQLYPKKKMLLINLDYSVDHPLLHWPMLDKSMNMKIDLSTSYFKTGDKLENNFSLFTNASYKHYPRFMKQQNGFAATLIFSEHADYADLRTHKAVYFGSEKITHAVDATGGFIGHHIPVTKSVFYSNPDHVMNSDKAAFVNSEISNIESTPGYNEFLKDLDANGIEICLHTPDHYSTNRGILQKALSGMQRDFKTVTWIDHGYDNSPLSNREDLVCDGLDSTSGFYAADLWHKYGIKYLWNCYYEDSSLISRYGYNSFLTTPYSGYGDAIPGPDYWRHPTRSQDLLHWRTNSTMDPVDGSLWNYYFNEQRLRDFIQSRGVNILHCYPARIDSTNGFYTLHDGEFAVNKEFDRMLETLAAFRDRGLINLSTVHDWMDYQELLTQVEYSITEDGNVILWNKGISPVKGLTMAIKASEVRIKNKKVLNRRDGNDLLFWFDLDAGEKVVVTWK